MRMRAKAKRGLDQRGGTESDSGFGVLGEVVAMSADEDDDRLGHLCLDHVVPVLEARLNVLLREIHRQKVHRRLEEEVAMQRVL